MTDVKYISTQEAAHIMGLSTRRVVGLCNAGKLEGAVRVGRSWQIPKVSVYDYIGEKKTSTRNADILSCAVGNTSYMDVVKNSYYVDKTLLIRDLIDDQVPVILFTRPRRFGKTLALDMLKSFFEKTKEDTSVYFTDKQIWACGEKYQKMQGAFPVISITFKDAKFHDWNSTYIAIKNIIRDEFMRHEELFTSDMLNSVERDYLIRLQSDQLNEVEYTRVLLNLSRMLEKHHQTKVVILIDEYDTPIQQCHSRDFYSDVISSMRNFMSGVLKDNTSLALGVLTGILRVSKENLFSGLNNPIVNSVLDEKYNKYFGFTVDEVNAMASYYGREEKMDELREWYNGYRFGGTEIYNPWSVANYFYNNCHAKPYWTNTSDNEIIHEILSSLTPEIAENLFDLVQGGTVQASLNMDVIYPRITDGTDTIFSFLLIAGYLRPVSDAVETEFGTFLEMDLPNKEIRRVYNTEILSWLRGTVDSNVMAGLEKALYLNDGKKLQESGEGRFDLTLEPKVHSMPGIIMEFKAVKNQAELSESAEEALKQIDNKHYDTDMKDRGITEIVKYGISFSGKNVEIIKG